MKVEAPCVATGMERIVGGRSGMIIKAKRGGTVTFVDAERIIIDNADEYVLRKFVGLNERTCQNQKSIAKLGQKVKAGKNSADRASTQNGELAIGKTVTAVTGENQTEVTGLVEKVQIKDGKTLLRINNADIPLTDVTAVAE